MNCKKCGAFMPEESGFCPECGTAVDKTDLIEEVAVDTEAETEETVAVEEVSEEAEIAEEVDAETAVCDDVAETVVDAPQPAKKNKGVIIGFVVLSLIAVVSIIAAVLFATGVLSLDKFRSKSDGEGTAVTETMEIKVAMVKDDIKITNAQFEYYYASVYNYYLQVEYEYQSMGMSIGFPTNVAPDEASTGETDENGNMLNYDDIIIEYAASVAQEQFTLYRLAKANGYSLKEDEKKEIDEIFVSCSEEASANGITLDEWIHNNFSDGINEADLREILEIEYIATRYHQDHQAALFESVTDADVEAAYNAAPEAYADYTGNVADVRHCLILTDVDGDGTSTEEEKKAAYEKATLAKDEWSAAGATEEAFIAVVTKYNDDTASTADGGLYTGISASSNYVDNFKNWAIDSARKAGDCEIVETEYGYHVMYFVKGEAQWRSVVKEELQNKAYNEWYESSFGENGKYVMEIKQDVVEESSKRICDKIRENLSEQAY